MNPRIMAPPADQSGFGSAGRTHIEAALKDSEARFQTALEYAPVPIMLHTLDGEVVAVNRAFTDSTGYTHAEVSSGREWFIKGHRVPEDEVDDLLREIHQQMRAGTISPKEMPVWTKWGECREWLFHGSAPVKLPDGRLAVVSTAVDVTDRRRAEEALRASQERFERATRAARELIYEYDLVSGAVWRSAGMAEVIGISPEDAKPTVEWWQARIHPDDLAQLEKNFAAVQQTGLARAPAQYRVRNAQGEYIWVEDRALVMRDGTGAVTRLIGSTSNIEERKRRETQIAALNTDLAQQVEEFETLFRGVPLGIAVAEDAACTRIRVNPVFEQWLGIVPGANASLSAPAEQRPPVRFFSHGRELATHELPQQVVGATGRALLDVELDMVCADNRSFTLFGHALPLFDADGRVRGSIAIYMDITDRKRMEQALLKADRRKNEFIATLAHELRNPLAPIRNATELLRRAPEAAAAQRAVDMIERHVRQLSRLVDDLLDVSRISKGKITLRTEPVLLADVVERARETVRPLVESRGHRLEVSLPPQSLWLLGDEARLTQILVNMLNNAAKYTDEGGRIELSAGTDGAEVTIGIKDNGIGMEPHVLSHAFEMFEQADHSLGRAQGGLGIGLTLVKSLVEMHGGTVQAFSAGIGQGSEFVLRLPLIAPPQQAKRAAAEAKRPVRPLRILVVDDNVDSASSMAMLLQFQGHRTETANDGPQAIEAALAFRPDVLLLDIGLPSMDGYEVARHLRALPQTRDAVLIALTGYGQAEDRRRSQEAGFDHHLVKPVEPESVSRILQSLNS